MAARSTHNRRAAAQAVALRLPSSHLVPTRLCNGSTEPVEGLLLRGPILSGPR
jgi:hypothetical protein